MVEEAGLDRRRRRPRQHHRPPSGSDAGAPVLLGSHIDTVVRGGRYDGALGVLGALEVIRTLNDHGVETRRPIAVVNWTNEEGVRFEPAMTCSGAVAGRFSRDYVYDRTDREGLRFGDELRRIGYLGDAAERPVPPSAYLELHIEQGPVLEAAGLPVGVVGGIVGITWLEVVARRPIRPRRPQPDASPPRCPGCRRPRRLRRRTPRPGPGRDRRRHRRPPTVEPNIINTIPGKVTFSVDFRHPDPVILDRQVARLESLVAEPSAETGVTATVGRFWTSEPTPFAPDVLAAVRAACRRPGPPYGELWSGAGHDAKYLAGVCPSAMIFVRSQGGLSHCETEYSTPEDIEAGTNVLLGTTMTLAEGNA